MRSYLLLFTSAFCLSFAFTPLVRAQALRWKIVDHPNEDRRIHRQVTPRLGGVAIFLSLLLTILAASFLKNAIGENLIRNYSTLLSVLAPMTLIFILGVWDDWRGLSAPLKFSVQIVAATMLYGTGWRIHALSLPFDGQLDFPHWMGFPITVVWILLITNAFNLIDGIDGLATGASSFALLSLFISALLAGNGFVALLSLILLGAALGFLPYNFNPATIFLGDAGSLLLGFMAATLSLMSAQKSSTMVAIAIPLVSFGLPLTEVSLSVIRRYLTGVPLFTGDRGHIHHKLLDQGLSQRQVVILLYGVCAAFTFFGILLLSAHISVIVLVFFILGLGLTVGVQRLGYTEINEFGAQLKSDMIRHPLAIRSKIQLRQRCRLLHTAANLDDLSEILREICLSSDCERVQLEVFHAEPKAVDAATNQKRTKQLQRTHPVALHSLAWTWQWQRDQVTPQDIGNQAWSLRLPLAGPAQQALGALTIFSLPSQMLHITEIVHLGETLQQELATALLQLHKHSDMKLEPQELVTDFLVQEA